MLPENLLHIPASICKNLKGILTDIDGTLTTDGQLLSCAYEALAQAKEAGLMVVVVTGRPAGWVDHIARMWPVDGVIGENGAFYFYMDPTHQKLRQRFLHPAKKRQENRGKLNRLANEILKKVPGTALASDQAYRACDLAIDYCEDVKPLGEKKVEHIVDLFKKRGATCKVSSIHVNGWYGRYDKLKMTQIFFKEILGIQLKTQQDQFVFLGDSPNDEPLFAFFTHAIGVANLKQFLPQIRQPPQWITDREGSQGFQEAIQIILGKR